MAKQNIEYAIEITGTDGREYGLVKFNVVYSGAVTDRPEIAGSTISTLRGGLRATVMEVEADNLESSKKS